MGLTDIAKIFLFLLGTALQIVTLILMARRKGNKKREIVFALFTFSVLAWSFGIFTSLFSGYLYRGMNLVEQNFGAFALFSFPLIFPLLTHSLLSFLEQKYYVIFPPVKYAQLTLLYLSTLLFVTPLVHSLQKPFPILERLENFVAHDSLFMLWQFVLLTICWYMVVKSCREVEAREERNCLGMVGWGLTSLIALGFVTFILQGRSVYGLGPYLVLMSEVCVFLLPPLIAYYLYGYSYMEYVFKRGLLYCMLGVFVIALYLSFIRPMGEVWEKEFQINFRMIEGILVMALVFFFDPLKKKLHDLSNRVFFTEKQYYRKVFSEISLMLNQSSYMELENLLTYIAATISRAMKFREVSFIFFVRHDNRLLIQESTMSIAPEEIQNLVDHIEKARPQILNIYDMGEGDAEILREMRKIKAFTIIPISNENNLIGIFTLGRRLIRHQLLAEEEEMLIMLACQIVTAIENTRLAREKFAIERKMYENEKLSSLGRLSASIAHEVKNPLSSIKTIVQVMKEELPAGDANQEGLTLIIEEIDRLTRVVKQLLLFARPHTSKIEAVKLCEVVQNVLLLLRHEAERNQVSLGNELSRELIVISDKDALSEVFFNLLHNSIQAMPSGGEVKITHTIQASEDKGELSYAKIRVADTGPGIPPGDREKIFDPFYTTKQTGTGLGLTIVRDKLEKLSGKIMLAQNDPGAVFEIYLPMNLPE